MEEADEIYVWYDKFGAPIREYRLLGGIVDVRTQYNMEWRPSNQFFGYTGWAELMRLGNVQIKVPPEMRVSEGL